MGNTKSNPPYNFSIFPGNLLNSNHYICTLKKSIKYVRINQLLCNLSYILLKKKNLLPS